MKTTPNLSINSRARDNDKAFLFAGVDWKGIERYGTIRSYYDVDNTGVLCR
jgi:hypothetical protein